MSKKFIYILSGFIAGGCVGAVGSYLYLKKAFDDAQKKIESDVAAYKKDINNTYKNLMASNMKPTGTNEKDSKPKEVKESVTSDMVDYAKFAKQAEVNHEFAKQTMDDIYGRLAEQEHPEDDEEDTDMDYNGYSEEEFNQAKKVGAGPRIIRAADYGEDPKLDCKQLIYYTDDDTLATEDDEIVDDISGLIGDALTKYDFINNNEDSIYVRNERRSTDYEIIKVHGSFSDYAVN